MYQYRLFIGLNRINATKSWSGIASATYREALEFVPASQIYGLLVKASTMKYLNSSESSSGLDIIDYVVKVSEAVNKVLPLLPYPIDSGKFVYKIAELLNLDEKLLGNTSLVFGGYNMIPAIKTYRIEYYKKLVENKCFFPLWLITLIPQIITTYSEKGYRLLKSICREVSMQKYMIVGVPIDRFRRTAIYGKIYSYQYTVPNIRDYLSIVELEKPLDLKITSLIPKLGIGFKKTFNKPIDYVLVDKLNQHLNNIDELYLEYLKAILKDIYISNSGRRYLMVYAYDSSLLPIPRTHSLIEASIGGFKNIYLEITNKFYRISLKSMSFKGLLVEPQSYYILGLNDLDYNSAMKLIEQILVPSRKNIIRHKLNGNIYTSKILDFEKKLIDSKVSSSYRNLIVIPYMVR